ncbi:MAG: hypothetical protein PHU49_01725, partial [Syntrophorhabdaceae bacterium]|nr:hypothetical protein [Syntrophorhabdaceae bacterium]
RVAASTTKTPDLMLAKILSNKVFVFIEDSSAGFRLAEPFAAVFFLVLFLLFIPCDPKKHVIHYKITNKTSVTETIIILSSVFTTDFMDRVSPEIRNLFISLCNESFFTNIMVVLYYSTNGYVCQYEGNNIHVNPAFYPGVRNFFITAIVYNDPPAKQRYITHLAHSAKWVI